jgi:hypothetical protein
VSLLKGDVAEERVLRLRSAENAGAEEEAGSPISWGRAWIGRGGGSRLTRGGRPRVGSAENVES